MSVNYRTEAGYGFFSDIQKTNWSDPATHERRDKIWAFMPQEMRSLLGSSKYFFEEDFDHEVLRSMLTSQFPELDLVWYGDAYAYPLPKSSLFVGVKSTLIRVGEDDGPVDLSEHGFVSAAARAQLQEVAALFAETKEPRWFAWMSVS